MRTGAVVLHYRHWPAVATTLRALLGQTRPPEFVLVLDNASGDGSADEIAAAFPGLEICRLPENQGYGAAMNQGIARCVRAGVEGILLLTHECRLAPDALEALIDRLEQAPEVGAVGPLLGFLDRPGEVFSAGGRIHDRTWDITHLRSPDRMSSWSGHPPRVCDFVDGAAILLRASAARVHGGFDPGYFLYYEEVEYQLRLRRAGWSVECVPDALAWQATGSFTPYYRVRNRLRFLARNSSRGRVVFEVARIAFRLLRLALRPRSPAARHYVTLGRRGLVDFLAGRTGAPRTN